MTKAAGEATGVEAHSCNPRNSDSESAPKVCPSPPGWQCRVVVSAGRGVFPTTRTSRYSRWASGTRCKAHPSGFLCAAFVSSQPHVTRFPASECGTCFGLPDSPRLWPLAPSAPQGVNLLSKVTLICRPIMPPPCGTEGQLERSRSRTSSQDEPSQSFLCRSSLVAFPSLPDEKEFLQPKGEGQI